MSDNFDQCVALLKGDNLTAATQAAEALGRSGDPRALDALQARFAPYHFMGSNTDEQNEFYFRLALVLAEMGSFHAYRIVGDEDAPSVRGRVVDMLDQVGRERAIHAAVLMLDSTNPGERYWAAEILFTLKVTSASATLIQAQARETSYDVRLRMIGALAQAGDADAIPVLEAILENDRRMDFRRVATYVLEKLKSRDS